MGRMLIEGLRTDSLYIGTTGIRVSQMLSGLIVIVCIIMMIILLIKHMKNPKPIEGVDFFVEPVPFLKKNREKFEKAKAEAEKETNTKEESKEQENVHKD